MFSPHKIAEVLRQNNIEVTTGIRNNSQVYRIHSAQGILIQIDAFNRDSSRTIAHSEKYLIHIITKINKNIPNTKLKLDLFLQKDRKEIEEEPENTNE